MSTPARPTALAAVWAGPAVAIVLVAVAGQVFGVLGAVIGVGCSAAAISFSAGEALADGHRRRAFAVAALVLLLAAMTVFAWQGAWPWSRATASAVGGDDLRGQRIEPDQVTELRGASLAGADLAGLEMRSADLAGVAAPGATFRDTDLTAASLRGADLRGADLRGACLIDADLAGADLTGANVAGAAVAVPEGVITIGTPASKTSPPSCR
ncbi:hypothetical protein CFP66_12220 [Pseudonocardia sp. MH-G8]|nr:hypothetical protein CFP66_12220 [Pseudonocardia sp. MH-G8]